MPFAKIMIVYRSPSILGGGDALTYHFQEKLAGFSIFTALKGRSTVSHSNLAEFTIRCTKLVVNTGIKIIFIKNFIIIDSGSSV